jgi:hypothetical protein
MLSFLFFILVFVLVVALIILSTLWGFIRSIFGFGKRRANNTNGNNESENTSSFRSKIFEQTEGEYVDYEEIK